MGRVQAITFYRLSYRLQLHGACWLLPGRAFQKGSVSHISSEQEGNTEGRTVLCQSLRKTRQHMHNSHSDSVVSFQLREKYLYFHPSSVETLLPDVTNR